jgi:hypothetical protein
VIRAALLLFALTGYATPVARVGALPEVSATAWRLPHPGGGNGVVWRFEPDPGVVCYAWKDNHAGGLSCLRDDAGAAP